MPMRKHDVDRMTHSQSIDSRKVERGTYSACLLKLSGTPFNHLPTFRCRFAVGSPLHRLGVGPKLLWRNHMRKLLPCMSSLLLVALALFTEASSASDQSKDDDRLKNCGTVLKEILDVPDDIPQDLLDKADCVVVFPSVLKAAFIIGGSYGRGAMSCRRGENFRGPW